MEQVRQVSGPTGAMQVRERSAGGGKRQAEAFRRALQEEGARDRNRDEAAAEQPVRTGLQPGLARGRREEENARHVDVIA